MTEILVATTKLEGIAPALFLCSKHRNSVNYRFTSWYTVTFSTAGEYQLDPGHDLNLGETPVMILSLLVFCFTIHTRDLQRGRSL